MRVNTMITLGASAAFGVLAIFLARSWINDAVQSGYKTQLVSAPIITAKPDVQTQTVLVADAELSFGDMLTPQSLRAVEMPVDIVPEGTFESFESLFGVTDSVSDKSQIESPTIALIKFAYNEPIIASKISGPGARGSLSLLIDDGMRAATIWVNDTAGVSGFVLPGDHVDVLLMRDLAEKGAERNIVAEALLQNVKVLGIDQNLDQTTSGAQRGDTVTLQVTPQDAQRLLLAEDVGSLSLTLRRAGHLSIDPMASIGESALNITDYTSSSNVPKDKMHLATSSSAASPAIAAQSAPKMAAVSTAPKTVKVTIYRGGEQSQLSVMRDHDLPRVTHLAGPDKPVEGKAEEPGLAGYPTANSSANSKG